jgi:hypothetical protein
MNESASGELQRAIDDFLTGRGSIEAVLRTLLESPTGLEGVTLDTSELRDDQRSRVKDLKDLLDHFRRVMTEERVSRALAKGTPVSKIYLTPKEPPE